MHILCFSDRSQLEKIKTNNSNWLLQYLPMTSDMSVAFELERLNFDFIYEWDFLSPAEMQASNDEAHKLAANWWDENIADTNYDGFTLTYAAEQDLIYFFEASLNANLVYTRLFDQYPIKNITGYFLPPVPVIRTGPSPISLTVQSVSQAILFYIADMHGVPVKRLY